MRRLTVAFLLTWVLLVAGPATAGTAHGPGSPVATAARASAPPPVPKAWVLVDNDTGAILDAGNDRLALPPASITKVLTALIAVDRLPVDTQVTVSALAAGMPALKINMKAGEVWSFNDALHALLMVSANDAAVALAEQVSGSLDAFAADMGRTAASLHMADHPVLNDPAGLDDQFSFDGGNRISARDMAIATRAAMTFPEIRSIVATTLYQFIAPDGTHHHMRNHNLLLAQYPGAIGVKTGFTRIAGSSLIGAATRNGRTMLVVLLGAPDRYRTAAALLDKGFATAVSAEAGLERLPPIVGDAAGRAGGAGTADATGSVAEIPPVTAVTYGAAPHRPGIDLLVPLGLVVLGGLPTALILRRRAVVRRRRARRLRREANGIGDGSRRPADHDRTRELIRR